MSNSQLCANKSFEDTVIKKPIHGITKKFLASLKKFTSENAQASLNKNLQFRKGIYKIKRENSHTGTSNRRIKLTEQPKICEGDNQKYILPESRCMNERINQNDTSYNSNLIKSRASSLTSEMSMNTSFGSLIGWAYSKTKNGDQGSLSKKEAYNLRYVNERVEIELEEFKEEIEKKFKISKVRNFIFPRKSSENQAQYGK